MVFAIINKQNALYTVAAQGYTGYLACYGLEQFQYLKRRTNALLGIHFTSKGSSHRYRKRGATTSSILQGLNIDPTANALAVKLRTAVAMCQKKQKKKRIRVKGNTRARKFVRELYKEFTNLSPRERWLESPRQLVSFRLRFVECPKNFATRGRKVYGYI